MVPGGTGTRQLARRNSPAEIGGKPIPAEAINNNNESQTEGGNANAPGFAASAPLTIARQERLPLAPLQRVTPYEKRNIAEFLTFVEAISLMLSSKDMHLAIQADPWLRLDEISPSLQRLEIDELLASIQSLEAQISAGPPADAVKRSISFAGLSFQIRQSAKAQQAARQAQERETKAQGAQLTTRLEALEPVVEDLVFHFASERMKGPRLPGAAAQLYAPPAKIARRLHEAIDKGDVELVRAGLREFLSLPERLMPNARKIAWLREPLKSFGQHRCGKFEPKERQQYEAIIAYVDEIVSSQYLSDSERSEFCHKPERLERDARAVDRDIFGYALFYNNPAVAAAVLLGIHESSAEPPLKQALLAATGPSWGGLGNCVDCAIDMLRRYDDRAPEWFGGVIARLRAVKTAPPPPAETKG